MWGSPTFWRFEAGWLLLFCTSSFFLSQGVDVLKCACLLAGLMWCPVTGWDLVGRHVPLRAQRHKPLLPVPSPSHITGQKISHCRRSDARAQDTTPNEGRPLANRWCVTEIGLLLSRRDKGMGIRSLVGKVGEDDRYYGSEEGRHSLYRFVYQQ